MGDTVNISYLRKGKEESTDITFTDYSIENDKEAQKDFETQEQERAKEQQQRRQQEQEFFNRFRQEFENGF